MVAVTSIEAQVRRNHTTKSSSNKRSKDKMGKSSSPNHQPQLLRMLEDDCHNSFLKLPNEEPLHKWNTDEVEAHNQRMKKLDKKLAKYNDDIAKLKEMLRQADEKHQVQMDRIEQREREARQEIVDLEEASKTSEQQAVSTEVQYGQLQARLETNMHKMSELRAEGKTLAKELRKKEKQLDKIKYNNKKMEESSSSLLSSFSASDLHLSKIFDEHNVLDDALETGKDRYEELKCAVKAMQDRYMGEATQRLELQKTMAEILNMVQGTQGICPKLANACTKIGLDAEARSVQLMTKLEDEEEWRNLMALEQM